VRSDRARLALCAVAIVLAEALLFAFPLQQLSEPVRGGDGAEYLRLASNLLHHGVFSDSARAPFDANVLRAPGYPAILALLKAGGLGSLGAIRVAQLALLGLAAWVTGLVALRLGGRRAGLIATAATAGYLPLVWSTTEQMTETAGTLGLAVLVLLVFSARERGGLRLWALAGLVLAATAYVRPTALALAVPAALFIAWDTRRIAAAAVFAAACAAAVAPWSVRTSVEAHTPVALQVGSGAGRYASAEQNLGRLPIPLEGLGWVRFKQVSRRLSHDLRKGRYTPSEQVAFDRRMADAAPHVALRDRVAKLPARLRALWGPVDATPTGQRWTTSLQRLALAQYWLLAALLAAGLWLRRRTLLRDWPLWLPAVYLTAVHTVIHVESRYSLPARPGLIVFGALAAAAYAKAADPARQRAERVDVDAQLLDRPLEVHRGVADPADAAVQAANVVA
jgi:4-amino-4-deoxy-L-arabinose transferase-like glycosyltransferase